MKSPPSRRRKIALLLGAALCTVIAGYAGFEWYVSLRQARLVKDARRYIETGDSRSAQLCLVAALRHDPNDVAACRLMAELAAGSRAPNALLWRARVVELSPNSVSDRLAWAQTALLAADFLTASNAMEGVAESERHTADYHNIAGLLAAAVKHTDDAELHFQQALALEPQNWHLQLNLALTRLKGTNEAAAAQARGALEQLRVNAPDSGLRQLALRALTADALGRGELSSAQDSSRELLQDKRATFEDRLLRLDVLREASDPSFDSTLDEVRRLAGNEPSHLHQLALWQIMRTSPAEALAWLRTLPLSARTNQPLAQVLAECQLSMQGWRGLRSDLEKQNWADLEFLRRAFLARALRAQNMTGAAQAEWESSLRAASQQKQCLTMLAHLATQWNWLPEREELLWTIYNRYPDETWAFNALGQAFMEQGRTRSLLTLYSKAFKISPEGPLIKNNLATTALLLDASEFKPHDLARQAYEQAPSNSFCISTYAFSLYLQSRTNEALALTRQLSTADLQQPALAGYYGLILKSAGEHTRARELLEFALNGSLLPEERRLFQSSSRR